MRRQPASKPRFTSQTKPGTRPVILCVDDDPDITWSVQQLLSEFDVEVVCGVHGQQGIWDAVNRHPDLIITDLRMPYGDGEDLITCLRRNGSTRHIPIIVLSGLRGDHLAGQLMRSGANGFLRKPVRIEILLNEIGKFVELRETTATAGGGI